MPENGAAIPETGKMSLASKAFNIHVNSMERGTTSAGIRYHYGEPQGLALPDFLLYGQMFQAMLQGGAMEALRFRKGDPRADCEGALVWSYNDCWGEMGWSVVDHYARPKASYYWIGRACAPVKIIVRCPDGQLVTRIINDTLESHKGSVGFGWMRLDGSARDWQEKIVTIPANGMVELARVSLPSAAERDPGKWIYAATIKGRDFPNDQAIWLLAPHRQLAMSKPRIATAIRDGTLEVSSPMYCHAVHCDENHEEALADDYFDLLPNVPRRIPILDATLVTNLQLTAVMPIGAPESP